MTIFELGALGEFFGSLVVVFTLVVLIYQIRQNTKSLDESRRVAMAMAYQVRAGAAQDVSMDFANSPYLPEIMTKLEDAGFPRDPESLEVLDPTELKRFRNFQLAQQIRVDNQFYQYQQGFLDEEYYQNNFQYQIRSMAEGWKLLQPKGRRPSFNAEVDRVLALTDQAS
jgi:hypothetical protein